MGTPAGAPCVLLQADLAASLVDWRVVLAWHSVVLGHNLDS